MKTQRANKQDAPFELREASEYLLAALRNISGGKAYRLEYSAQRATFSLWVHPNWKMERSSLEQTLADVLRLTQTPAWSALRVFIRVGVDSADGISLTPYVSIGDLKWIVEEDEVCYLSPRSEMWKNVRPKDVRIFDNKRDRLQRSFGDLCIAVEIAIP